MFGFVGRVSAMLAGIVIVGFSLFGAVGVLFVASLTVQRPGIDNGCCGYPESWGELIDRSFIVLTMASTDALIFAAGVALLGYATERHWPSWRTLRWLPILAVGGMASLMAASLASGAA